MRYFVTIGGREILVEVDGELVRVEGREVRAHLSPIPGTPLRHLLVDDASLTLAMERGSAGGWQLLVHGTGEEVEVVDERTRYVRALTGGGKGRGGPSQLKAPMPGLVVQVLVAAGQAIEVGQSLIVLEAMKMENELRATAAGQVATVSVQPGQAVDKGQLLIEFAPREVAG